MQGTHSLVLPIAGNILAVVCFIAEIRSRSMLKPSLALVAAAGAAYAAERVWPPLSHYAAVVEALPHSGALLFCRLAYFSRPQSPSISPHHHQRPSPSLPRLGAPHVLRYRPGQFR